jgi:hypothetical protein
MRGCDFSDLDQGLRSLLGFNQYAVLRQLQEASSNKDQ